MCFRVGFEHDASLSVCVHSPRELCGAVAIGEAVDYTDGGSE